MTDVPDLQGSPPITGGVPPGTRIDRFVVEETLGRGGTATVLVVRDPATGRQSALKLLHAMGDDERLRSRFRREFRALARLGHPNVLKVEEWGIHEGRPWFTMELVRGRVLRDAIHDWAALPPEERFARVRDVLVQVTRALACIHERDLVHRDITPGNVMIRDDGVVKLMDFGLVTDRGGELTNVGEIVGTVAHIAPEQLRGERLDARADLYALGTVLYQMLTGRKPFTAHTVQGWVERHLHERPRPPREIEPLVPELLDRVCMRLLEKDPKDRFASAVHLLQVLGDTDTEVDDHWPPRFVGRTGAKAWIRATLDEIAAGRRGGALMLTGGSGSGKTRALDRAEHEARRLGLRVARARCKADRPFGLIADLLQSLAPATVPPLLRAAIEGGERAPEARWPVLSAFREVVEAAAPCVILVDQVEQSDPVTRDTLEYLVRNTLELAEVPVAYLVACESEENLFREGPAPARPEALHACSLLFSGLGAVERQHFGPLSEAEVEEVVMSVVPDHDIAAALARRVHAETDGRAAWVADMLRGLVDQGLVVREGGTWRLRCDPASLRSSELPLPEKLRAALEQRVAPLSEQAREVGRLLAIARGPLSLDVLVEAASFDEERVMAAVDELLDADVAVERRRLDDDTVELSHARFRDVLLEAETPESLAARHRRLGGALERAHRYALADAAEALAWHFEQGGVAAKAYAYLAQTVAAYQQRGLFEEALARADRALNMEPEARRHLPLDEADRRLAELRLARTRSLYHLGRWEEALAEGRVAVALAERVRDADLLARTLTRLGYILRNSGQLTESRAALERAIAAAHDAHDPSLLPRPLYHLGAVAWAEGRFEAAEDAWTRSLELAQEGGFRRAEGMAHNGLGILLFCRGRSAEARAQLELAADIFREVGMVDYLAIAQVNLIELYLSTGLLRRAQVLVEKTVAQSREVGHSHGTSLGLVWRARLQLVVGRPAEAARTAREALRSAEAIGSVEEQASSLATLVQARIALGEAADALDDTERLLRVLASVDPEGLRPQVVAMHVRVLLARGEVRRAELAVEDLQERPVAPHVAARRDVYVARALAALGREASALQRLEQALRTSRELGYRWYELLALHELARIGPPAERDGYRTRARSLARTLASGLSREDADAFLARNWGEPEGG